jgi:hypothetical protein
VSNPTQPGWHPDPYGSDEQRWFDGSQWAGLESDYGSSSPEETATRTIQSDRIRQLDAWEQRVRTFVAHLDKKSVAVGVAVTLVLAVCVYGLAGHGSAPTATSAPAASGITTTGSFCHDFQTAASATPLISVNFAGHDTRASALRKLIAMQKEIRTWQAIGTGLETEAPATLQAGLAAMSSFMASLVSPDQTAITAVSALPINATAAAVSKVLSPLLGALFAGALGVGAAGGKAITGLPAALNAACGAGFANKLGIHTS